MSLVHLPCPFEVLVPHRASMLLMDLFCAFTAESGEAEVEIRAGHLFEVSGGALHPAVVIEMLAQSAAAHEGYRRRSAGGGVGGGFLVGIRDFELIDGPRMGDTIRTFATRGLRIGELQFIHGDITRCGQTIGTGELLFYLSDELVPEVMRDKMRRHDRLDSRDDCQTVAAAIESSLVDIDPQSSSAQYCFEPWFPAFAGHFPSVPILPAVVSLICAEDAVARLTDPGWSMRRVKRAKFMRPVLPGEIVTVVCKPDPRKGQKSRRVEIEVAGNLVATLDIEGAIYSAEAC